MSRERWQSIVSYWFEGVVIHGKDVVEGLEGLGRLMVLASFSHRGLLRC